MPLKWEYPKCQEKGVKKSTQCSFSRLQEKIFVGLLQQIYISQYHSDTLKRNMVQRAAYTFSLNSSTQNCQKFFRHFLPIQ